jgi:hypothetical protein
MRRYLPRVEGTSPQARREKGEEAIPSLCSGKSSSRIKNSFSIVKAIYAKCAE